MRTYPITRLLVLSLSLTLFPIPATAGEISGSATPKGLRSPADVLVYLADAPETELDYSKAAFVMDQKDLTFRPHVLPIPVGASISFPNNDAVDHNVFSISRAKTFNLGSYKPGQSMAVVFDKPGLVELRCDVHAEMLAYILVLKTPYFAVTGTDGKFSIPNADYWQAAGIIGVPDIPAGEYVLKTWHEKLKTEKQTVSIPKGGRATVQLDLVRGRPGVLYK